MYTRYNQVYKFKIISHAHSSFYSLSKSDPIQSMLLGIRQLIYLFLFRSPVLDRKLKHTGPVRSVECSPVKVRNLANFDSFRRQLRVHLCLDGLTFLSNLTYITADLPGATTLTPG